MCLDEKALGYKSTGDKSVIRLLKSPNIMVSASGVSMPTICLSSNPYELCDRIKLLLQGKQAAKTSNIIIEDIVAIAYKLLEDKGISSKQLRFLVPKSLK